MIPKPEILEFAKLHSLLPATVQKDYVLGWMLRGMSENDIFSNWIFKGGTCLKKCYFETFRFSEDLDFTIPKELIINTEIINQNLQECTDRIEENTGIQFPEKDRKIEEYKNLRGQTSYQVKISYNGPLSGHKNSLPRIKFDITQDEIIADTPVKNSVYHYYSDRNEASSEVLCYSINEILAEKSRALYERSGRARDVYDIVNISRNFREFIDSGLSKKIAVKKFQYKDLPEPTADLIFSSIDYHILNANWEHQLRHQISHLPGCESYYNDLKDALTWWLEPEKALPALPKIPAEGKPEERKKLFPGYSIDAGPNAVDLIRTAARSRQCVYIEYEGKERLMEPYCLRYSSAGEEVLYGREPGNNDFSSDMCNGFSVSKIRDVRFTDQTFSPKWEIEL